jgi:hypothetical protein
MARSGCIYGPTGAFKSTQIKCLAHYIARKYRKATYLLSLDGGGWEACDPEVKAGMINAYRCEVVNLPLQLVRKISQGFWPENPKETDPAKINLVPMDYENYGALAVEGWTSIGSTVMRYLADNGISVGGEKRDKDNMQFIRKIQIDHAWVDEVFGSSTRGDYNFILRFLHGFVTNCGSLPLEYILHTALEAKTEDDDRTTIYGPAIEGKKGTAQCGAWVGDLIHAQDFPRPVIKQVPDPQDSKKTIEQSTIEMVVRFYFKKHLDPNTAVPFPAKPRITPEKLSELDKIFPGGYFEPFPDGNLPFPALNYKNGFDVYLDTLDRLSAGQADALKDWRAQMDAKLGRGAPAPAKATTTTTPTTGKEKAPVDR